MRNSVSIHVTEDPNLFGFGAGGKVEKGASGDCSKAFDLFYEQSFRQLEPRPARLSVRLPGNASRQHNWPFFFNAGANGSEGYEGCFQHNRENLSEEDN